VDEICRGNMKKGYIAAYPQRAFVMILSDRKSNCGGYGGNGALKLYGDLNPNIIRCWMKT